jgi:beta-galactosidase
VSSIRLLCCASVIALATAVSTTAIAAPALPRAAYSFEAGWRMVVGDPTGAEKPDFDDSAWKPVTLPRAFNEDSAFKVDIHDLPVGVAWYRKRFVLPANPAWGPTGKAFLEFQGLRQAGDVYLNGVLAGRSENGIMAFGVDATKYLKPAGQENLIAVRVDSDWKYKETRHRQRLPVEQQQFLRQLRRHQQRRPAAPDRRPVYQTLPLYSSLGTTGNMSGPTQFDIKSRAATIHAESQVATSPTVRARSASASRSATATASRPERSTAAASTLAAGETQDCNCAAPLEPPVLELGLRLSLHRHHQPDRKRQGHRQRRHPHGFPPDRVRRRRGPLNDRVIQMHGYAQRTTNEWPAVGDRHPALAQRLLQRPDGRERRQSGALDARRRRRSRTSNRRPRRPDPGHARRRRRERRHRPPLGAARRSDARRHRL